MRAKPGAIDRKGALKVKSPRYILACAVAGLLVLAPAASAHVTLQPEEVVAGDFTRLDVRVPSERDDAGTTKVDVQFPPGFLSVSTEPVPGWQSKITMRKLDKPVEQFGEQVTEEVGQISFTGGEIARGSSKTSGSRSAFRTSRAARSASRQCRPTPTVRWCAGSVQPIPTNRRPR